MFFNQELLRYETSISHNPFDTQIYVPDTFDSTLFFRMIIEESSNCTDQLLSERKTTLSIIRSYNANGSGIGKPEEVVAYQELSGYNPICDQNKRPFGLSFEGVEFTCSYYGSEGTTAFLYK